jgi:diguanylate cyclase (GGDEF)-like protein
MLDKSPFLSLSRQFKKVIAFVIVILLTAASILSPCYALANLYHNTDTSTSNDTLVLTTAFTSEYKNHTTFKIMGENDFQEPSSQASNKKLLKQSKPYTPETDRSEQYGLRYSKPTEQFKINKNIVQALAILRSSALPENTFIFTSLRQKQNYNIAEQYLLLIIDAIILKSNKNIEASNRKLEQAILLEPGISDEQLVLPLFSQLHLILANNYMQLGLFKKAYLTHRGYFIKFNTYHAMINEKIIEELSHKHQVIQKAALNDLLQNQNRLKQLHLVEEEQLKENQQRNFALIICTILLFTIFFTRKIKQKEKLILQAKTDSVSGFLNRKSLFNIGAKMVQKFIEDNNELSLVILKVKPLYSLNQIEIEQSDRLFSQVAVMMSESTSSRDSLFRLTTDEFVVLLPNSNVFKAKAVAQRMIERMLTLQVPSKIKGLISETKHDVNTSAFNLSIGISALGNSEADFQALLHKADLAMYQAFEKGDNSIIVYDAIANHFERRAP